MERGIGSRPQRLCRSRTDRVLAGVAGGLGYYFQVDPVLFRLAFVFLAFVGGAGILMYLVGWLVIPEAPDDSDASEETAPLQRGAVAQEAAPVPGRSGSRLFAIVLVGFGLILLFDRLLPELDLARYWPVLLILLGIWLLARES